MYVLVHLGDFSGDPLAVLRVWEGGMMYFGGLVLGILFGSWTAVRLGLPLWRAVDPVAPMIGAGQAVGRVACLAAGCCYGKVWAGSLALTFHDPMAAVPPSVLGAPLILTQVLQIGEGLLLWALGAWLSRRRTWDGQAFLWTVAAAGVTRSLLEELRGDAARGFLMPGTFGEALPSSRVVGIAMVVIALGVTISRSMRARTPAVSPSTV